MDEFTLSLQHPSTISICGPIFSAKSSLVSKIIKERDKVFDKHIDTVIYVFKEDQPLLQELARYDKKIIFTKDVEEANEKIKGNTLLILDDQLA